MNNSQVTDPYENVRIALLRHYNAKCITHAGYVIGLLIGLATVISRWETFEITLIVFFSVVSIVLSFALLYASYRTIYWSKFASEVIYASEKDLLEEEKERNNHMNRMEVLHKATANRVKSHVITMKVHKIFRDRFVKISMKLRRFMGKITCRHCGTENESDAVFCMKCGKRL